MLEFQAWAMTSSSARLAWPFVPCQVRVAIRFWVMVGVRIGILVRVGVSGGVRVNVWGLLARTRLPWVRVGVRVRVECWAYGVHGWGTGWG